MKNSADSGTCVGRSQSGRRSRRWVFALVAGCACSGGQGGLRMNADGGGGGVDAPVESGGAGGTPSGGSGFTLGVGGRVANGGTGGAEAAGSGGAVSQTSSCGWSDDGGIAGDGFLRSLDFSCEGNGAVLWDAITRGAAVIGICGPAVAGEYIRGSVVFDGEGRIVGNTRISRPADLAEWLSSVCDQRWPCWAGQTLEYSCTIQ